jgi:Flp pilus assembly protein TadB
MTDPDLKDLADLWQQEPDPAEQRLFEAVARKVRRRARFLAYVDVAMAVILVAAMVLGFVLEPGAGTAVIAGLLIVSTLWLSWKRRSLRQMSRTLDTSDRPSFIASSIRNAKADMRRIVISMWMLPALALMAILFKLNLRHGGRLEDPLGALAQWAVSPRGMFGITGIAIIMALLLRSRRKIKAELRHLDELDRNYGVELGLDEDGES